jgi:FtsZ-interacting cell division protein ZipA
MKNLITAIKLLVYSFLLIMSIIILFTSCSAVKKDKTTTKEEIKTETSNKSTVDKTEESNVKKTETTTVDDKNETITKETTYEPIDSSKPASITDPDGRKTDLNNSKKTTRETTQKNNSKTAVAKASDENHKAELSELSESDSKSEAKKADEAIQVDRKAWNYWNVLWLLIPAGVIYFVWKNKAKIIEWFNGLWFI